MNIYILILMVVFCLVMVLFIGKNQLKSDNDFFYKSGRSMRPIDIFMAFEKKTFNERVSNLEEATRDPFKKWLMRDMLLGIMVHAFVALLALWCMTVYTNEIFIYAFYIIAWAQVFSCILHVLADLIMRKSVVRKKLGMHIVIYNIIVLVKMIIPLIGIFMCTTTLILFWFQFLHDHDLPMATLFFLMPVFFVTLLLIRLLTSIKKTPIK